MAELRESEELASIRPDLDGREVMAHLGIGPRPVVGRALPHLLELRLEEGPHSREDALRLLDALVGWAARVWPAPVSAGPVRAGPVRAGPVRAARVKRGVTRSTGPQLRTRAGDEVLHHLAGHVVVVLDRR